jgi:hypothetical protein
MQNGWSSLKSSTPASQYIRNQAMRLKQYQIDAFATRVFEGNPAAVCPLDHWLDDSLLQAIANENNLSETAFFVLPKRGFTLDGLRQLQKSTSVGTQH